MGKAHFCGKYGKYFEKEVGPNILEVCSKLAHLGNALASFVRKMLFLLLNTTAIIQCSFRGVDQKVD